LAQQLGALQQTLDLDTALGHYFNFPQQSCCIRLFSKTDPMKKIIDKEIRRISRSHPSAHVEHLVEVQTEKPPVTQL
jgi:hypothetical protein